MRIVENEGEFDARVAEAREEAAAAFGNDAVFLERFVHRAKHIEVQIMGDKHGNILHLYERDCSVQRRHQKVVEVAPAINLDSGIRKELCEAAVRIARAANYFSAGTVEFLVDVDTGNFTSSK
jgi:pyruvate carboxylase